MHFLFEIYDSKAETFSTPFTAPNAAVGLRMFAGEATTPTSTICKFPGDFTLFEVGTVDNGKWTLHDAKINHGLALQFRQPSNNRTDQMVDAHFPTPNNSPMPLRVADSVADAHYLGNECDLKEL